MVVWGGAWGDILIAYCRLPNAPLHDGAGARPGLHELVEQLMDGAGSEGDEDSNQPLHSADDVVLKLGINRRSIGNQYD